MTVRASRAWVELAAAHERLADAPRWLDRLALEAAALADQAEQLRSRGGANALLFVLASRLQDVAAGAAAAARRCERALDAEPGTDLVRGVEQRAGRVSALEPLLRDLSMQVNLLALHGAMELVRGEPDDAARRLAAGTSRLAEGCSQVRAALESLTREAWATAGAARERRCPLPSATGGAGSGGA